MKNEKAIITSLAYIIGFTTAFIGFGLQSSEPLMTNNTAQVFVAADKNTEPAIASRVEVTEEGLFYVDSTGNHVISVYESELESPKPGYHSSVTTAQLSPDGSYVHYCVIETSASPVCTNYLYSTGVHVTHPVTREDNSVLSGITARGTSWNKDGQLTVEGFISINKDMPWRVVNP